MDDFDFGGRNVGRRRGAPTPPPQLMGLPSVSRGQADLGAVSLAISGMTFYWVLPLMMGGRRKRGRRANRSSQQ